jgi:hypothetical protein
MIILMYPKEKGSLLHLLTRRKGFIPNILNCVRPLARPNETSKFHQLLHEFCDANILATGVQ